MNDDRLSNIALHLYEDRRARFRFSSAEFLLQEVEQAIHQRFEKQVVKYKNHIAVKDRDLEWTYLNLNRRANRISRAISTQCHTKTERIALLFGHDDAALCAMIGVLKSGKVYVPIVTSNPFAKIKALIEDAQISMIVTHNKTIGLAQALVGKKIQLLNIDKIDSSLSDENPGNSIQPDSLACILYTSGSTGKPKGVMQTHRNILHQVYSYTNKIGITASDRLSLLSSFDVGAGHLDIYASLLNGASLYPYNVKEEGLQQLNEWLISERITVYHSVPTLFRHITRHLTKGALFPEVRVINLGGEYINLRDIELFRKYFSRNSIFVNSLACTEAGPFAHYFADHNSEFNEGTVPAGYSTEDMEILLLDDQGKYICGDGVGEILIKSHYLSPGYWQKPGMTETAFKSDLDKQGIHIYHTGDLGRIRPNGLLEYLGRKDSQVKVRGYRVEIPAIEIALHTHPAIKDAAVVANDDLTDKKYLTAYIVLHQGEKILPTSVRAYLENILSDYMIPSMFVFMEYFPMTPNGKLDRNALRAIQPLEINQEDVCMISIHPVEQKLIEVWRRLLKMKHVRVTDNFFDLGGDSLTAIELFCWIEKEYGKQISSSMIYKWSTIEQLASLITDIPKSKLSLNLVPIRIKGSTPPLFVIPNILGNSLTYSTLLQYLDPNQMVYGIEMSENDLHKTVKDAAAFYVNQIREVFPVGPYSLIGFSSGGILALEMARRLSELDCKVSFLAMIDTIFTFSSTSQLLWIEKISHFFFLSNLLYWLYYTLPFRMNYYMRLIKNKNIRLFYKVAENKVLTVSSWLTHYKPEPYSGRVLLYRAKGQGLFTGCSCKKWGNICSSLDIYTVPGNHITMMQNPHVRFLAENIDLELRKSTSRLLNVS